MTWALAGGALFAAACVAMLAGTAAVLWALRRAHLPLPLPTLPARRPAHETDGPRT